MFRHIIFIFLFAVSITMLQAQQQWPLLNGGTERTSWAEQEDQLYPPLMQSTVIPDNESNVYEGLTYLNGKIMCVKSGEPNTFMCIDETTGDTLWSFAVPNTAGSCLLSSAQNDSLVFAGGQHGDGIYALDRMTGQQKWLKPIGSLYGRSPVLDEDRLYIVNDSLYCIDVSDGSTIWAHGIYSQTSPMVDDDYCYYCTKADIYAFDKHTGAEIWIQTYFDMAKTSLASNNQFIFTLMGDSVAALNKSDGSLQWSYEIEGSEFLGLAEGSIALTDSILCVGVFRNADTLASVYAFGAISGNYQWHHTFDSDFIYCPVIANDVVYVTQGRAKLYGLDLYTGQIIFEENGPYLNQPIVANHKLYVPSYFGIAVYENDTTATRVAEQTSLPEQYLTLANYPNPFNPQTTIQYTLTQDAQVTLTILNINGQQVTRLFDGHKQKGSYNIKWHAENHPSGLYFCEIKAVGITGKQQHKVIKLVLQK